MEMINRQADPGMLVAIVDMTVILASGILVSRCLSRAAS